MAKTDVQKLTKLTDASLVSISNCRKLQDLDIRDCLGMEHSWGLESLVHSCANLQVLRMRCDKVNNESLKIIGENAENLRLLEISDW